SSSPVVFTYQGHDVIAAANSDGRLYVVDSRDLSVAPVVSAPITDADSAIGGTISTWEDANNVRWLLVPRGSSLAAARLSANDNALAGAVVAFKLIDQDGKPGLQAGWTSRNLIGPVAPLIMNGVVFALSTGTRSLP